MLGESKAIAEKLYRKSLEYHPIPRAYLGIGMIRQKSRDLAGSIEVLSEGVKHFPDDELINTCLDINYMNLGQFNIALSYFLKFQESQQALNFVAACYEKLADHENAATVRKKIRSLQQGLMTASV